MDETCDDGEQGHCNDTCDGSDPGWTCTSGDENTPSTCESTCGDKILVNGEECDDGNIVDLDGCSSDC